MIFLRQIRIQIVDKTVGCCGKGVGFPDNPKIIYVHNTFGRHAVQNAGGDGSGFIVLIGNTQNGIVMLSGIVNFIIFIRNDPHFLKQGPGGLIAGIGGWGDMSYLGTLEVGDLFDVTVDVGDELELVAVALQSRS